MTRPRLLDLFCGAGGAAMGYHQAGFDVVGVDIAPQPHYPFEFRQMDALTAVRDLVVDDPAWWDLWDRFDAVHASPPCQAYTTAGNGWKSRLGESRDRHPDLLDTTRQALQATGLPYVIENVPGAPMPDHIVLCGLSFGLGVRRHRWFETNWMVWAPPPCPPHDEDYVIVFGGGVRGRSHQIGRTTTGKGGPIIRRPTLSLKRGQEAMGIDWMDRNELSQAIPPAYTEFIGEQLIRHLAMAAAE
jgi:DNA (cytosine-5)-methyltransferase 1